MKPRLAGRICCLVGSHGKARVDAEWLRTGIPRCPRCGARLPKLRVIKVKVPREPS